MIGDDRGGTGCADEKYRRDIEAGVLCFVFFFWMGGWGRDQAANGT